MFHDRDGVRGTPAEHRLAALLLEGPPCRRGSTEDQRVLLLTREREEARQRADALAAELRDVVTELKSEQERRRAAERRARESREAVLTDGDEASSEVRGAWPAELELRVGVLVAWYERYAGRLDRPLPYWIIGERFLADLEQLQRGMRERVVAMIARIVAGGEHPAHPLRVGPAGGDPVRVRSDGARACRTPVQVNSPAAIQLHYWKRPDGAIEFASVGHHDRFDIPER